MFRLCKIDSLDLPELQPYRTMRRQEEHKKQGIFVGEGEKVVSRIAISRRCQAFRKHAVPAGKRIDVHAIAPPLRQM